MAKTQRGEGFLIAWVVLGAAGAEAGGRGRSSAYSPLKRGGKQALRSRARGVRKGGGPPRGRGLQRAIQSRPKRIQSGMVKMLMTVLVMMIWIQKRLSALYKRHRTTGIMAAGMAA